MKDVPLIARRVFFGNPDRGAVQLSPDGALLSWLAPLDGVLNVWVASRDDLATARPVTHDTGRGIRIYWWAYTNDRVLYMQDKNGDENWRLYAVDVTVGTVKDLTPFEGVQAQPVAVSHKFPEEIIVGLNNRNPQWHDIYRINLVNGDTTLLLKHERFMGVIVDDDYRLRMAAQMTPDGGVQLYVPTGRDWRIWDSIPAEDVMTTGQIGFDKGNQTLFMKESRGRNTSALVAIDVETMKSQVLAEDPRADAADVMRHPTEKYIQAVAFVYDRKQWRILDSSIEADLVHLRTVVDGEVEIASRSLDDRFWVVVYVVDDGPYRFYLYDRSDRIATFLFTHQKDLESFPLAKMRSVIIKSRDGLDLVGYYTLPLGSDNDNDGIPNHPLPMVFTPHGGPWWRDFWGYNSWHQWLANRGYAVLSVNFRASTGFGKAFVNAGDREWGGKIIEDQVDAVQWAIRTGLADSRRVAVMGGSFGGYSTLAGLTFTPELFACGVDLVGVVNLVTWIESVPAYWKPSLDLLIARVGDPRTEEGRSLLKKHSPLTYVDRICKPLLIAQGANDPRVKQAESDQIVQAMQAKGIPVTYLLYQDEGHGFARPENNLSFYAVTEAFLAKCMGGRVEPIGNDFEGSSIQVLTGVGEIPGLKDVSATQVRVGHLKHGSLTANHAMHADARTSRR